MKKLLTIILILFITNCSHDQDPSTDYGKTSIAEPGSNTVTRGYVSGLSSIRILDEITFRRILKEDQNIPTTPKVIVNLARSLYPERKGDELVFPEKVQLENDLILDLSKDSHYAHDLLFWALQNPQISNETRLQVIGIKQKNAIPISNIIKSKTFSRSDSTRNFSDQRLSVNSSNTDSSVCTQMYYQAPSSESYSTCVSDHFFVQWLPFLNPYATENDIIPPEMEHIVFNTVAYLEQAWDVYQAHFSKTPKLYKMGSFSAIHVVFNYFSSSLVGKSEWAPDNGNDAFWGNYIFFNSKKWKERPGLRKPISAHELFHRLQYEYGYKSNPLNEKSKWFTEGTASWAETLVWNQVGKDSEITYFFSNSHMDLTQKDYEAGEFWYYFNKHLGAMDFFLNAYNLNNTVINSVNKVLKDKFPANSVYGEFDKYLALYRKNKIWQAHVPFNVTNEDGLIVSPLQVKLLYNFLEKDGNTDANFAYPIQSRGSMYAGLYVDENLKGIGNKLKITFKYDFPFIPIPEGEYQYQLVYAKCVIKESNCGFDTSSPNNNSNALNYGNYYDFNIPKEHYIVKKSIYPFFKKDFYEVWINLEKDSKNWDLLYLIVGAYEGSSTSAFTIKAEVIK